MLFTGEYEHSIDAKLRLAIPAEIRDQLRGPAEGKGGKDQLPAVYAAPGLSGGIWLWPEQTFLAMAQRIERSLLPAEELLEFDEITFPEARRLELDGSGRVRLPERMLQKAGLKSNVVILGMRDHLEVRDPGEWNRLQEERHAKRREIVLRARRAQQQVRRPSFGTDEGGKEEGS